MTPDEELLVAQVTSAHRERDRDGRVKSHHAWHDLDAAGRVAAFDATVQVRALEAAADGAGLSATARAVLARIGAK
jgi:hypothetical protein